MRGGDSGRFCGCDDCVGLLPVCVREIMPHPFMRGNGGDGHESIA